MLTSGKTSLENELSLYFHIPFCTKKCSYCHFYVIPDKEPFKKQLLEGLKLEWERVLPELLGKDIITIYFGGGTPSLIGPEAIATILSWVYASFPKAAEVTLEANPENMSIELMKAYADAGINRVSIGIQTLDNQILKMLGRLHSGEKAIEAVYQTIEGGINNITIDLMYDLPNQTVTTWENTLSRVVELPITHLSLYNLTIEPHTTFYKQQESLKKIIPNEDDSLRMYEMAIEILSSKLEQYEISAFAKPGLHSRHNVGYWVGRPFWGFGPSAFSYFANKRFRNVANLSKYHKALLAGESPIDYSEELEPLSRLRELLAINLRLMKGVDLNSFQTKHGVLDVLTLKSIETLLDQELLVQDQHTLKLSKRGVLFYDTVAVEII